MKKILSLFALVLMSCMGAWAQTVIAQMQGLIDNASTKTATISENWQTDVQNGAVYSCANNTFIGGITDADLFEAFAGNKVITVAAWVYGQPSGSVFSFGGHNSGIKYTVGGNSLSMTTKGVSDFASQGSVGLVTGQWNLVAFALYGNSSTVATNNARFYVGSSGNNYWTKTVDVANKTYANPSDADKKFAIGSGNQGDSRENYNSELANLTIIQSDGLLTNAQIASYVGAAPTLKVQIPFTYASDLDHISDAKWYKLKVKNQWAKYNSMKNSFDWTSTEPTDGTGYFALVGSDESNLKIFNYSNGMAIGSGNVNTDYVVRAVPADEGKTYKLLLFRSGDNKGWQLEDKSKTNARLNHLGEGLGYWVHNAGYDEGNNIEFLEVEDLTAAKYFEYSITATGTNGNVTWKHGKFTNDTEASVSHIPAYNFISNYAIASTNGHNVNVTAISTMPMVAGKFYQLKYGTTYLSYTNEKNVNIKAPANNVLPENLWYVQNCAYAPYVYLFSVKNEKAVNATSNGADNILFSNSLDGKFYTNTGRTENVMAALELLTISGGFKVNRATTTQNLGSHGNNKHDGVDDGANTGLGLWNNGGTAFTAIEFDENIFNGDPTIVGSYVFGDAEAVTTFKNDRTAAHLAAALANVQEVTINPTKVYSIQETVRSSNQNYMVVAPNADVDGNFNGTTEIGCYPSNNANYSLVNSLFQFVESGEKYNIKHVNSGLSIYAATHNTRGNLTTETAGEYSVVHYSADNTKVGFVNAGGVYLNTNSSLTRVDGWKDQSTVENSDGDRWTVKEVTEIPVTVSSVGYTTINLPVAVTIPAEVKAYKVIAETETSMTLEEVTGDVPANTALIIEAAADTYNFSIATSGTAQGDNKLQGTTARRVGFGPDSFYALAADNNAPIGVSFKQNGSVEAIPANKAYLPVSAGSSNKALYFDFGGITTGIDAVETQPAADALYNINGQRVVAPTRGIYVKANGQKVFIK